MDEPRTRYEKFLQGAKNWACIFWVLALLLSGAGVLTQALYNFIGFFAGY